MPETRKAATHQPEEDCPRDLHGQGMFSSPHYVFHLAVAPRCSLPFAPTATVFTSIPPLAMLRGIAVVDAAVFHVRGLRRRTCCTRSRPHFDVIVVARSRRWTMSTSVGFAEVTGASGSKFHNIQFTTSAILRSRWIPPQPQLTHIYCRRSNVHDAHIIMAHIWAA